jgi:hypothetical protein
VLDHLVEVGVAVQVVEVLQDAELVRLLQIRVGLVAGDPAGEVDRDLLVGDGRLQDGGEAGQQPVDGLLLLLPAV